MTAKRGTTLPFDVADVPVIFWDTQKSLKEQLRKRLTNVVRTTNSWGRPSRFVG